MHSKKYGIPAVAIVGSMGQGAERIYDSGIDSILTTVNAPMELHAALEQAEELYLNCLLYTSRFSRMGLKWIYLKQIFQVGIPAGIQSTVINFSNVLLQSSVNSFGSVAMADVYKRQIVDSFCPLSHGANNGHCRNPVLFAVHPDTMQYLSKRRLPVCAPFSCNHKRYTLKPAVKINQIQNRFNPGFQHRI